MTREEARRLATGYAWAYTDFVQGAVPVGGQGDLVGSFAFSNAYAQAWQDFNDGKRMSMMPVRDAFKAWLDSDGTAIEGEWRDGELRCLPLSGM